MKIYAERYLLLFSLLAAGCSDSEHGTHSARAPSTVITNTSNESSTITDQPLMGRWKDGSVFAPDQVIWRNNRFVFRKGPKFWPTQEISVMLNKIRENTDFKLDGHNTSVTVRRKKPGAKVPDTKFIHHVAGRIIIGKKGKLGIPIQINITGSENLQSRRDEFKLEGKAFATIGDLKMKDQNVDLSYDSMDTLRFVGKQYLANKHHVDEVNIEREFKLSRKYIRNIPYPQSGFLSIRYLVDTDSHVAKLQLYKDKNSWEVVRELKPTQIAPAHPIKEINESDLREVLHQKVAATLETALKEENLMSLVRSVNLAKYDCKIDKNKTIGLCKATIKVEQEDDVLCQKRNYLAEYHERDAWMVNKTVSNDLKLDYQTGKLVKKDKRTGTEKIAMKVFNFVFNECN